MKGFFTVLMALLINGLVAAEQVGLRDYLKVVIEFTENNQNLEAVKLCDKLVGLFPENADVYFLRGINKYLLEDYDGAIQDLDKTLSLNPDYPDAHLYRAKSKKASKDYIGALRDYSIAKDKNFTQTVSSLTGDALRSFFAGKGN